LLFYNIDKPSPEEVKEWMKINELSINSASEALGISKRQILRFLSGETSPKRVHALAMQMIWLINENKRNISNKEVSYQKNKKIKIIIK
tara:strand:+ start:576 stop:842 length:267 start_codon:yes stop_codon:yes gene_type:complete